MWFWKKKEPMVFSTFYSDHYREQIERIRRGEPIDWPPGAPINIRLRSMEIDRLNAKLDELEAH